MLGRLVYVSDAAAQFKMADLPEILTISRRNNERDGLTGVMVFHEGRFFQVLEGEMDAVMGCFNRIMRDPRHAKLMMIETGQVAERAFGQWRMGFARPNDLTAPLRHDVLSIYDIHKESGCGSDGSDRVRRLVGSFLNNFSSLPL